MVTPRVGVAGVLRETVGAWRAGRRRRVVVIGLAAAVVVALLVAALVRATGPATPDGPARGASVALIGDSFSAGTAYGGQGTANWAALLADDEDWHLTNVAVGGVGYVASLPGSRPFAGQVDGALAGGPDAVLVEGSRNDADAPPGAVGRAATALFRTIHERAPGTEIVVIGPIWSDGAPPPAVLRVRDEVRLAAFAAEASFVDPVAQGWFASPAGLIGPDGVHPNDAGHRLMAQRVREALHLD